MKIGSKHTSKARLKMQLATLRHNPNFLGKHHTQESIKKIREARLRQPDPRLGKLHSLESRLKMSNSRKGEHYSKKTEFKPGQKPWNYGIRGVRKIKPPFYTQIHTWLKAKFGKAEHCQNVVCEGKSKYFQWAKLKQFPYEFKREYFVQLCMSCHHKYDKGDTDIWIAR